MAAVALPHHSPGPYAELHTLIKRVVRRALFPDAFDVRAAAAAAAARAGGAAAAPNTVAADGRPARLTVPASISASPLAAGGAADTSASGRAAAGSARPRARHPSAAERRASIARCRVLRAEIARFEADFRAAHGGREPRSASERFPLAHV
jgi:hypothetical protein